MIPPIDRFMGALQGACADPAGEGTAALEIAESILANDDFVIKDVEAIVKECAGYGFAGAAPLWRAIPVGLLHYNELEKLKGTAEKSCRLTHGDPADIAATVAMALAVAMLLRLEELSPPVFAREIAWFVRKIDLAAYDRIMETVPPLKGECPFVPGDLASPLEIFQAALFLFLSSPAEDLETAAASLGIPEGPVLPLAYSLAGSLGRVCRLEKPSLRVVMIAEGFRKKGTE